MIVDTSCLKWCCGCYKPSADLTMLPFLGGLFNGKKMRQVEGARMLRNRINEQWLNLTWPGTFICKQMIQLCSNVHLLKRHLNEITDKISDAKQFVYMFVMFCLIWKILDMITSNKWLLLSVWSSVASWLTSSCGIWRGGNGQRSHGTGTEKVNDKTLHWSCEKTTNCWVVGSC